MLASIIEEKLSTRSTQNPSLKERREHREVLRILERGHRLLGRRQQADLIPRELDAMPPRDPSLGPKHLDLTEFYVSKWWDGLAYLPETFFPVTVSLSIFGAS